MGLCLQVSAIVLSVLFTILSWWRRRRGVCRLDDDQLTDRKISNKNSKSNAHGPKRFARKTTLPHTSIPLPGLQTCHIDIIYVSLSGTSKKVAQCIADGVRDNVSSVNVQNCESTLVDDCILTKFTTPRVIIVVVPSYDLDVSPTKELVDCLHAIVDDFRVDAQPLQRNTVGFCVFGIGDLENWPGKSFCNQAAKVQRLMVKLGGRKLLDYAKCDICDEQLNPIIMENDHENDSDESVDVVDVEDLGPSMKRDSQPGPIKDMVPVGSKTFIALNKQGYTIVGSHSGVKICRWTKSALRGRGSCYKYSFYGIHSHLCMETTPSLACANKCVFCWRHGTNPVATSWKWNVDEPEDIVNGAMAGHYKKILSLKGLPGLKADRFETAMQIRHCALSLVGEPIFYPHINKLVDILHSKKISTFLVCNAQHPDELNRLQKVTQLYVSIDAPTKDSLKKIDRPLHSDFWDRTLECLNILRKKNQRTVFRFTLVKQYNVDEIREYVNLIRRGQPEFIEIKGMTFCGKSDQSPLTMKNVPFYEEVINFVQSLKAECASQLEAGRDIPPYDIAAEHSHSCCVLLAQTKYYFDERWHTQIDFSAFFRLLASDNEFGPLDYLAETPEWAYYGKGGFNPQDTRFYRKKIKEPE